MNKLENKVAVITGAAAGMGKAIAQLYAKEGAKVVLSDINESGIKQVAEEINAIGGMAIAVPGNIAIQHDVDALIDTAVNTYGTLDILVNNAGIMDNFVPAEEVTDELWERVMGVNLTGPMRTIRKSLPIFRTKVSGTIINIASVGGLQGSRAGAAYTASKHALIGLTKNVAFQYADQGVRCNAIAPGGVNTSIGDTIQSPNQFGLQKAISGAAFNPRSGEADEIATIALFLASTDASFVNGAVIVADGGWTAY
ncbi:SDR family oxidoreductase [Mucilaginibacter robiniae]|uniref:SDR family oxidoreductase n=1 Tax=Mucilaginibacter robiniae TaxID=2728022 RepID=A0A7L5ECE4_9SPHI|nr:SDR family oxidoreductase [Mucilaginibacter robiniae]QJD98076.1 SDR family oxidoreductase [Mucilaginibacter robiniae]